MPIARTPKEIEDQQAEADDQIEKGQSKYPGMSYEDGVSAALRWATGNDDTPPMEE